MSIRNMALKFLSLAACLSILSIPAMAEMPGDKIQRPEGAVVVPEHFLRRWDPLTVFFDTDRGPAEGGAEDHPERLLTLAPSHPGTYRWLNARTLQFRPIEPWAALTDYRVTVEGRTSDLTSLMEPPAAQVPTLYQRPRQIDSISLGFAEPIDPAALAKMITVDLRAVAGGSPRLLTGDDFSIKTLDRTSSGEADLSYYSVNFATPIPESTVAVLHLKLSNRAGLDVPLTDLRFQTDEGFRLQRIDCGSGSIGSNVSDCSMSSRARALNLTFNAMAADPDPLEVRKLVRLSPPVDNFTYRLEPLDYGQPANRLVITGSFKSDIVYQLHLDDARLPDSEGRPLKLGSERDYRFVFAEPRPALSWDAGQGIVERLGPQMVPLRGQGFESVDLRIHPVDPLSRDFWPFPNRSVRIDENAEPPLAGTEPAPRTSGALISAQELADRLKTLGSPSISELVALPLKRGGTSAKFGIDLKPYLTRITGKERPGHYLVGIRKIDGSKDRDWMRIQVTDLALSSVEQWDQTHFFVTSLATGKPMAQASVKIEGRTGDAWTPIASGETDATGHYTWNAPGSRGTNATQEIRRIVVSKGDDTLVIDPARRDQAYNGAYWTDGRSPWLQWAFERLEDRKEVPQTLCHVFTERPIYRPEEPVHIKGFVRQHEGGRLSVKPAGGTVIVTGPNDEEWRLPVTLSDSGSFYQKFDQPTDATGDYKVRYEFADRASCGDFPFKKEAYRLPTFEVLLDGPEKTPLDAEFEVAATARYFAGGLLADRPLKWRVTQFPHTWNPPNRPGFLFSSDARFSGDKEFRSTPVLQREVKTDAGGSAKLALNPMIEPTAQPRRYLVEATVIGADDIQVRTTQQVIALPPFVLGLKVPRYVAETDKFTPQMLALRYDGEPLADLPVTVKLKKRRWNSILQASDFTQGTAKYVTEIVDDLISEQKLTSTAAPQDLALQTTGAGVYIVELTAEDRLGRTQTVAVDFFLGGNAPVTWSRPPAQGVTLTSDADSYVPGQTAKLVIQSPFQSAEALVVTEEPDGRNRYDWLPITNGYGTAEIPIQKHYMPKVPVHVMLMRGRLPDAAPTVASPFDLGKPATLVGTAWLEVKPVQNIVTVAMSAPAKARPAETIDVALKITDETGKPLSGEATFWMVDQAILSLAKEQPLDPLPAFIRPYQTRLSARDTRNQAFGILPLMEDPGGDVAEEELGLDNISVRKNFTPVPIYLPTVPIGPDGVAHISVPLPDSLTVFKLRAMVISGPDRFGFATGEIQVRLPIVAQPVLPRFVRTGDSFGAGIIGRLIEGDGGAGTATIAAQGLTVSGDRQQNVTWTAGTPLRQSFQVAVPSVGYNAQGVLSRQSVTVQMGVQRTADKAGDAVEVVLPLRADRAPSVQRDLVQIDPGKPVTREMLSVESRPGSLRRTVLAANEATLVKMASAFDMLLADPYGTTERKIGQARAELAWKRLGNGLAGDAADRRRDADIAAVLVQINQSTGENGLVAPWPRGTGSVALTAWSLQLIAEAEAADYKVDEALKARLVQRLKQSLRTDAAQTLGYTERVWALAGLAAVGASDAGYLAELARRAQFLDQESLAQVVQLLAKSPTPEPTLLKELVDRLWDGVRLQQVQGQTIYAGLSGQLAGPTILASEARSLALTTRAMAVAAPTDNRRAVLTQALVRIGDNTGWGSTNATAEALMALIEIDALGKATTPLVAASVAGKPQPQPTGKGALWRFSTTEAGPLALETSGKLPVTARIETRAVPRVLGNQAAPETAGFVVSRSSLKVGADGILVALEPQGNERILSLSVGDVVEDVAEVITPEERFHVALTLPLAAGMEPLNPNLATAPAEALAKGETTLRPDYVAYLDDQVTYFYERLPKGTYRFATRTRATIPGTFTQPAALAEMMYDPGVRGASAGARLVIAP